MALFKWDKSLSVKIKSIDDEHKELIQHINVFYDNFKTYGYDFGAGHLFEAVVECAKKHFETEEIYMQKYGFPEVEVHKEQHDAFLAKAKIIERELINRKLELTIDVVSFLKEWIKDHIAKVDQRYSNFFQWKGVE